jgi:hypothetical protein
MQNQEGDRTYHVDALADEIMYFGASVSGTWQDTNVKDSIARVLGEKLMYAVTLLSEGFESGSFSANWTAVSGTGDWSVKSGDQYSGTYYARGRGGENPPQIEFANLTFNAIELPSASNITLSFMHQCDGDMENAGTYQDYMYLYLYNGTDWENVSYWTGIDTNGGSCPSSYTPVSFNISDYAGPNFQFRFSNGITWEEEFWRIDDIELRIGSDDGMLNVTYVIDNVGFHNNYALAIVGHGGTKAFDIYTDGIYFNRLSSSKVLTDGFEEGSFDANWSVSGGGDWSISSSTPNSGTYSARGNGNSKGTNGLLTFNTLDISSAGNATLSFMHRCSGDMEASGSNQDDMYFELYNGSWNTVGSWTGIVGEGGDCPNSYTPVSVSLGNYLLPNFQFRFRHGISSSNEYWYVDDVVLNTTLYTINLTLDSSLLSDGVVNIVINNTATAGNDTVTVDLIELYGYS